MHSNDSIQLGGVLERRVDHVHAWNIRHFLLLLQEVKSVASDLPYSPVLLLILAHLLVLLNELHQLGLVVDHKHLLHIRQLETVVGTLS